MQTQVLEAAEQPQTEQRIAALAYGQHIVATPGVRGGKARIVGRRIAVSDIAFWCLQQHHSVDEQVNEYNLTHAQIHAALTYYYDHQSEIDEREAEDSTAAEALKQTYPSRLQVKLSSRD